MAVLGNIEVVAVRRERSEVRTKTTERQYSPVRLELARLVGSLLYGTLALNLTAFNNQKYAAYDCFYGNGRYSKNPTKKEPIKNALPYNNNKKLKDQVTLSDQNRNECL